MASGRCGDRGEGCCEAHNAWRRRLCGSAAGSTATLLGCICAAIWLLFGDVFVTNDERMCCSSTDSESIAGRKHAGANGEAEIVVGTRGRFLPERWSKL
jgi:hypothetical protein